MITSLLIIESVSFNGSSVNCIFADFPGSITVGSVVDAASAASSEAKCLTTSGEPPLLQMTIVVLGCFCEPKSAKIILSSASSAAGALSGHSPGAAFWLWWV